MTTTIAVREETAAMLKQLQHRLGTSTHDETIRTLIDAKRATSMFGKLRTNATFKRESLDRPLG